MNAYKEIILNGTWKQNSILAQLLGLCPLLAISATFVNAVSLGLVLVIASLVTVVDLAFNAFLHDLYLVLGIFIPLIVTNCIVLARVEAFAAKNGLAASTLDGAMMGVGFVWVIGLLGLIREFVGQGTLFSGIEMIFPRAHAIQVLPESYPGFLISILPPGAFLVLGFMIAGRNWLDAQTNERQRQRLLEQRMPRANTASERG